MPDKHLNLFYTYNRDVELIENNLTRAFIVLCTVLTDETRQLVLSSLVERASHHQDRDVDSDLDFADAQFALQSNIERHIPRQTKAQVLLTIGTELLDVSAIEKEDETPVMSVEQANSEYTSIPDAWIVGPGNDYCILIEAKTGTYPLDRGQLKAHAEDWFGISLQALLHQNALLSVTWMDVLEVLNGIRARVDATESSENNLLSHFIGFLKFYGYRTFDGIVLLGLQPTPSFHIAGLPSTTRIDHSFDFRTLMPPPGYALSPSPQIEDFS